MINIYLKNGKEKPVLMGHPWIFNGAISKVEGNAVSGEQCQVFASNGKLIANGYYNAHSAISVRILSFHGATFSVSDLFDRIKTAIEFRKTILDQKSDSYRMINSEGDFLPGLIVDKFGLGLVVQILTAGMEQFRPEIIKALNQFAQPQFIYERSDTDARTREGLVAAQGPLVGNVPDNLIINEMGQKFIADIAGGQKTGFFFDQRPNRELLKHYAAGRNVCDCFSYSGAFSTYGLAGGAKSVDCVDISKNAIKWAESNVLLNGYNVEKVRFIQADVFKFIRETERSYDLIVLDPPKFAKHPGEVQRASRGYKDINLSAIKKIAPGGMLFTFSCSNAIEPRLFRQIIFAAAADAARPVQLLHTLCAGPDHPVNIAHREGEYLKGLVLKVL